MALTDPITGEYLRIDSIRFDRDYICTLDYKIYANIEHRKEANASYRKARFGSVNSGKLQQFLNALPNPALSIIDNVLKAGYEAIKADTFEFSTWQDA